MMRPDRTQPSGEPAIPETATTPPEAGESGGAPRAPAAKSKGGKGPIAFLKGVVRNSPWVVIAVVFHVVLGLVMSIMAIKHAVEKKDEDVTTIGVGKAKTEELPPEEKPPELLLDRNAIPKPQNREAEMIEADIADSIPTLDAPTGPEDLSKEVGAPSDGSTDTSAEPSMPSGGTSLGVGGGPGHFGSGKPSAFVGRKAGTGTGAVGGGRIPTGATEKTEAGVLQGLIWLVRHQQPDGSWSNARLKDVCQPPGACCGDVKIDESEVNYDEGLTGLALLAFLGNGKDHTAKQTIVDTVRAKRSRVGEVVKNGLQFLKKRQETFQDGRFSAQGQVYNESLATLAMCEAYGMSGHNAWKESAQRGVDFLVASQRLNPGGTGLWGWSYEPLSYFDTPQSRTDYPDERDWKAWRYRSDISATAWCVMALKSAQLAGLNVPDASMQGAMEFVKYVTVKDGRVAYADPLQVGRPLPGVVQAAFHPATLAALGMCVRTFAEKNIDDPVLELGAKQLEKDLPAISKDKLSVDYYYWYYGTLALNQFDGPASPKQSGKYWKAWNKALTDALLPGQVDEKNCSRGSWPVADHWSHSGGPVYRTAINVLTLEVYYRYENAFAAHDLKKKDVKSETQK